MKGERQLGAGNINLPPEKYERFDLDGDGYAETQITRLDLDGDGIHESQRRLVDVDRDGFADVQALISDVDWDGGGLIESVDVDLDSVVDYSSLYSNKEGGITEYMRQYIEAGLDHHSDPQPSDHADNRTRIITVTHYLDKDRSGVVDRISYVKDMGGDGFFEMSQDLREIGETGLFDTVLRHQNTMDSTSESCPFAVDDAVAIQKPILEALLGREFRESELRELSFSKKWSTWEGTPLSHLGDLLEAYGLHVEKYTEATLDDVALCLEDAGRVLVCLNADTFGCASDADFGPGDDAMCVAEVTKLDGTDADQPLVLLRTAENGTSAVPAALFLTAWETAGCFIVEAYQ